jgi:hypothetical protein
MFTLKDCVLPNVQDQVCSWDMTAGVVDTAEQFTAGVVDACYS